KDAARLSLALQRGGDGSVTLRLPSRSSCGPLQSRRTVWRETNGKTNRRRGVLLGALSGLMLVATRASAGPTSIVLANNSPVRPLIKIRSVRESAHAARE